jgi:hypothetical protein
MPVSENPMLRLMNIEHRFECLFCSGLVHSAPKSQSSAREHRLRDRGRARMRDHDLRTIAIITITHVIELSDRKFFISPPIYTLSSTKPIDRPSTTNEHDAIVEESRSIRKIAIDFLHLLGVIMISTNEKRLAMLLLEGIDEKIVTITKPDPKVPQLKAQIKILPIDDFRITIEFTMNIADEKEFGQNRYLSTREKDSASAKRALAMKIILEIVVIEFNRPVFAELRALACPHHLFAGVGRFDLANYGANIIFDPIEEPGLIRLVRAVCAETAGDEIWFPFRIGLDADFGQSDRFRGALDNHPGVGLAVPMLGEVFVSGKVLDVCVHVVSSFDNTNIGLFTSNVNPLS